MVTRATKAEENRDFKKLRTQLLSTVVAGLPKKAAGLMGLAVGESQHEGLKLWCTKIPDVLKQIPKNAAYRKYTKQITNEKLI